MTRHKRHVPAGERIFTDPRAAAAHIRELQEKAGGNLLGTRHAMSQLGQHPAHSDKQMSDDEAITLAEQTDAVGGEVPITISPTASSKPEDPRTKGFGYDPSTQRMRIEWGDGGTPYYYYDVTPQEAALMEQQCQQGSPGKLINRLFNHKNYGIAED
jgi:hypothetical protein